MGIALLRIVVASFQHELRPALSPVTAWANLPRSPLPGRSALPTVCASCVSVGG